MTIALNAAYPEYNFQPYNRITFLHKSRGKLISKAQQTLYDRLKILFPHVYIEQNWTFPQATDVSYPKSLKFVQYDVSRVKLLCNNNADIYSFI
jgi:hypothetical protein